MMATKKQKIYAIPDVPPSVDECTRAIEAALDTMDPPIDDNVHGGILRLIAKFAQPHRKRLRERIQMV